MSAIAVAELTVHAARDIAWSRFIDFAHWDLWMPPNFRPISGPARALAVGDKLSLGVGPKARLKLSVDVIRVRAGKEICWTGGPRLLLSGVHSFLFADAEPGQTRIRSEETLDGALTVGPLAARLERAATDTANDVLMRFADYLKRSR